MHKIINPTNWPAPRGYNNAIKARGEILFIAGQIGWDKTGKLVSPQFVPQAAQALKNIVAVLKAAGADASALTRLLWFVTDTQVYLDQQSQLGVAYKEIIGAHYPAMTLVKVAGLLEPGALVEIEAIAVLSQ